MTLNNLWVLEKSYFNHPGRKGGGSLPRGFAPSTTIAPQKEETQSVLVWRGGKSQESLYWENLGSHPENSTFIQRVLSGTDRGLIAYDPKSGQMIFGMGNDFRSNHYALIGTITGKPNEDEWVRFWASKQNSGGFAFIFSKEQAAALENHGTATRSDLSTNEEKAYNNIFDAMKKLRQLGFDKNTKVYVSGASKPILLGKSMFDVHLGLSRQLQSLIARYLDGEVSKSVFRDTFKRRLTDYYERAWREGAKKHGAEWQRGDRIKIDALVQKQFPFLDGFLQDMSNGRVSELQAIARTELYAKSAEAAYHHGRLARLGGKKLKWEMNPAAENCPDCIALNRKIRPATYWLGKGLVPKSGQTRCLGNCQCALSVTR